MAVTTLKRGYLWDKKRGALLEKKRWYVLRHDMSSGCPVLESFRDEKCASRGDSPKAFVNVHDVVEVRRVGERRQTFELLCPGVGYKLTAASEMETEEWMAVLRQLILYRKDSSSLGRATQPLSITPQQPAQHPLPSTSPRQTGHEPPPSLLLSQSPSVGAHPSLPTPPESMSSPPLPAFGLPRQRSSELFVPLPSPSTSSDSSSLCSGSNASFDQPDSGDPENRNRFRVHVKESDALAVTGPADLVVAEEGLALHSVTTGQLLVSWPIGALRRFGVNNVCFTIHTGRHCSTGEGRFQFYTPQSRSIHACVQALAMQKASAVSARRGSEPHGRALGVSPPSQDYTHIDRSLSTPGPISLEHYGTLAPAHPSSLAPGYDTLHHPATLHPSHSHPHLLTVYPQCPSCQLSSHSLHTLPAYLPSHHHHHSLPHSHHHPPSLGALPKALSADGSCVELQGSLEGEAPMLMARSRSLTSPPMH